MIGFKTFLIENTSSENTVNRKVESLPLHKGHDGTVVAADMLDGVFNKMLGKSSKVKTEVQHPGTVIGFGYNPKNGQFAVSHNDTINHSFEDIDKNYDDENLKQQLKSAATHLPKVTPKTRGLFIGKLVKTDDYDTPVKIMVTHDHKGKPLSNSQKLKFNTNPNVTFINPEMKVDPNTFKPDEIKSYKDHMSAANKSYGKIDPEVWDYINKGHHNQLERYIQSSDEPDLKGYMDHLTKLYHGKSMKAEQNANELKINRSAKKYDDLISHISNNNKHYSNVIEFLNHLKNASSILSDVASRNGNNNHILLMHDDNQSILKIKKAKNNGTV